MVSPRRIFKQMLEDAFDTRFVGFPSHRTVPHFPVTEAFNERATTYYCLSALLATTHHKAADRIPSNALKISTASAVYADNLVTGPPEPALRFSPRNNFLSATGKRFQTVNISATTFQLLSSRDGCHFGGGAAVSREHHRQAAGVA